MLFADDILSAKKCGDIFSTADKNIVTREYRALAKRFHPDTCALPNAEEIFKHLNDLYKEALQLLEKGQWEISNTLIINDTTKRTFRVHYCKGRSFELGECYVGRRTVTYLFRAEHKRFFDNAVQQIKALRYATDEMEKEFARYLPSIMYQFQTNDDRYCLILTKTPDVYPLSEIWKFYSGSIPDRHVAWIISRLCSLCCYLNWLGISHNGLTVDNCYISPQHHTIHLLGGWWYACKEDEPMLGVSKEVYDVMPIKAKSDKTGLKRTDLECLKLIGRNLIDASSAPKAVMDFLNSGSTYAIQEYTKWNQALTDAYGVRRFIEMKINESDIYG